MRSGRPPSRSTRSPMRISSWRSTAATSCTTAACRGWTSAGSGTPGCSRCGLSLEHAVRADAAIDVVGPPRRDRGSRRVRWTSRSARSPTADDGPSLSTPYRAPGVRSHRSMEFVVHRSVYHLREADPHTWAIPRLERAVEGGTGRDPGGRVRRRAGLSGCTPKLFEWSRCVSLGWTRRTARTSWTSRPGRHPRHNQQPSRRCSGCTAGSSWLLHRASRRVRDDVLTAEPPLRQRSAPPRLLASYVTRFFDEHVEADAVHENVAAVDLAGGLARQQPALGPGHPLGRSRAGRARRAAGPACVLGGWEGGWGSRWPRRTRCSPA